MIFQHSWQRVMSGDKTLTARSAKPGYDYRYSGDTLIAVYYAGRMVYGLGQSHAVQPGRGAKSVGRIQITRLRRMDVRQIADAMAGAEGYSSIYAFLEVWCGMHDKAAAVPLPTPEMLILRPPERYRAVFIDFLVKGRGT